MDKPAARPLEWMNTLFRKDQHISRLIVMIAGWLLLLAVTRFGRFYSLLNFQTMAAQFPEYGIMALGVMICMITGGIDLSMVGMANLTTIFMAYLLLALTGADGGLPGYAIPLVLILAVGIGSVLGLFNGILITKFRIPPILATLGSGELFIGISLAVTNGAAVSKFSRTYAQTINNRIIFDFLPVQLLFFVIMAVIIWFFLTKTVFGTKLYMLGTSPTAARFSGLNTNQLLIKTYMLSGICAALGGMIMMANYNSARADYGSVYTLQSILIVILGGVNPLGGKGKISGVILAVILLQLLQTGINRFPAISSYYIFLLWGGVLILVMVLNFFTENNNRLKIKKLSKD
jgi:simple sugar transport system permease protein